jgi:hypothetical protein
VGGSSGAAGLGADDLSTASAPSAPKIRSVLLAVALVACQEFDPDDADLSDTWLLSDSTVFPLPEGPFNTCLVRNVRLVVDPGPPAGMFAQTRPGGPMQCEINGVWREPVPCDPSDHYRISRDGQRIVVVFSNHSDTIYTGHLGSNDRMGGPVSPAGSWRPTGQLAGSPTLGVRSLNSSRHG